MDRLPVILITVLSSVTATLDALKRLQQGGYRGGLSAPKQAVSVLKSVACALAVVGLECSFKGYFEALYCGMVAVSVIGHVSIYGTARTKYRFTYRGTRLFAINCAVHFGISFCLALLIASEHIYIVSSLLLVGFSPTMAVFVAHVVYPFEKLNNDRYVKKAKAELSSATVIKIGITGSYGKTSCKYILAEMLKADYTVIKTDGNYNTPMGIVKTVFEHANALKSQKCAKPIVFIAEMGARYKGDIAELCQVVEPEYALITGVGEQHLETFGNVYNVASEKSELARFVRGNGGYVVYNGDNPHTDLMCEKYGGVSVGLYRGNYRVTDLKTGMFGLKFKIEGADGTSVCSETELIGRHNALNIALCYALAKRLKVSDENIVRAVKELKPIPHRLELKRLDGVTVIDDGYNANYEGVISALETLACFEGRKIVYAQGIVELGRKQKRVNIDVGRAVARVADVVILSGVNSDYVAIGLEEGGFSGKTIKFRSMREATESLPSVLKSGDVVLFQNDIP